MGFYLSRHLMMTPLLYSTKNFCQIRKSGVRAPRPGTRTFREKKAGGKGQFFWYVLKVKINLSEILGGVVVFKNGKSIIENPPAISF